LDKKQGTELEVGHANSFFSLELLK
jgi:hypothetical protein